MTGQCSLRYPGRSWTVMPSTPGLHAFALTRANACLQLPRSKTSSINCSVLAGLSALRSAVVDSVPSEEALEASLRLSPSKASHNWFFCRLSPMSRAADLPFPLPSLRRTVWTFVRYQTTSSAADFCRPVRIDRSILSPVSRTRGRSPEVSLTAFSAQPPDLQPLPLMDMGFAINCPLAQHGMPPIRFLFIGSRLCSALPSDATSPRRPCASL